MTGNHLAPSLATIRPDAKEEIPVLDIGPYLAGQPGSLQELGVQLRDALENIGFYFVINHGISQDLIDGVFEAAKMFHALPLAQKMALAFNGAARIIADLVGGAVKLASFNIVDVAPLIADGRVKPILVSTERRSALFPDVPTMQELGASSFEMNSWQGIFGPAGLPAPIVARFNAAFHDALAQPSVQEWISINGATPVGGTPEDLRRFVEDEQTLWGELVRRFNVTIT